MYVDALLAFSGSISGNTVSYQAASGTGATVLSTNTIDLGITRDLGEGSEQIFGRFEVGAAASGGTSIEYQIIATDANDLTGNVTVVGTTGAIAVASIVAGARFACAINPRLASKGQRYLGGRYITVGAVTAHTVYGDIGNDLQDGQKFYANGFAVL